MEIVGVAPGVQVTTTLPAPVVLTMSRLLGTEASEPKLMVPRLVIGLVTELPKAQPLTMVALTVKFWMAVPASAAEQSSSGRVKRVIRYRSGIVSPPHYQLTVTFTVSWQTP